MKAFAGRSVEKVDLDGKITAVSKTLSRVAVVVIGAWSCGTLVGCAGGEPSPTLNLESESSSGIIGGVEVSADDPIAASTVGLYDTERGAVCTGSIVTPQLILTAAHCVDGAQADQIAIIFGRDLNARSLQARPAIAMEVNPLWAKRLNESVDTGDIAILRFEGALPRGYRVANLLGRANALSDGKTVALAGFGLSDARRKTGTGLLRKVNVKIKRVRFSQTEVLIDQTQGRGACHGDSGGPAYIELDGKLYLFGVTSRGVNDPRDTCGVYAAYTNVLAHMNWLKSAARSVMSRRITEPPARFTRPDPRRSQPMVAR